MLQTPILHAAGVGRVGAGLRARLNLYRSVGCAPSMPLVDAIEKMAKLLELALAKHKTSDGRVDTRDVAAFVVGALVPQRPSLVETAINHAPIVDGLSRVLTQAFDSALRANAPINMADVAASVFAEMKRNQR